MSSYRPEDVATPGTSHSTLAKFLQIGEEPRFVWEGEMPAQGIGINTRIQVRSRLTVARWPGNIDAAARVSAMLAQNAVRHGETFYGNKVWLRLMCPQDTDDLVIEVDDVGPDFPDFDKAAAGPLPGGKPTGLWWVRHYRGRLAWCVKENDAGDVIGKSVQVVLPASWDSEPRQA